jgi:hypothetical protein
MVLSIWQKSPIWEELISSLFCSAKISISIYCFTHNQGKDLFSECHKALSNLSPASSVCYAEPRYARGPILRGSAIT